MFGNLSWDAIPLNEPIPLATVFILIIGILGLLTLVAVVPTPRRGHGDDGQASGAERSWPHGRPLSLPARDQDRLPAAPTPLGERAFRSTGRTAPP